MESETAKSMEGALRRYAFRSVIIRVAYCLNMLLFALTVWALLTCLLKPE